MVSDHKITLKPIGASDTDLIESCILLEVDESQRHFVDNPRESLLECHKYPDSVPVAVVLTSSEGEDRVVGFLIYEFLNPEKTAFLIWDFMIDKRFQKRGYGRKAMESLLEFLNRNYRFERCEIAYVEENVIVQKLYTSLGFVETGKLNDDGEVVMELTSSNPNQ